MYFVTYYSIYTDRVNYVQDWNNARTTIAYEQRANTVISSEYLEGGIQ